MASSYSRVLLRMFPLRRWPLPSLGPVWLSEPQPAACRSLWPSGPASLVDRVMGDVERQFHEMEKMSRLFFQATPLPLGRESPKETSEEEEKIVRPDGLKTPYRISVDVAGFAPEEMTVNLDGRKVTVTAKRRKETQSQDSGCWVEHQELRRETLLPPDVDLKAIACSLNPDGQLCIEAPRLPSPEAPQQAIPIDVKAADPSPGGEEDKPKER
ncbi:heat shock protein Hsp-16.1/Hsp-16.11-like [Erythrolamprus reginae]|uniref:heat shock protein Hsp-16.1/Hsp-16.11-like n=1 Tax=Erythrolamprus reginae TaxID=121349 RepID=UPI00396C6166